MAAKPAQEETAVAPEIRAKYEPVIGLEVHVQLLTKSKIFCACSTKFGDPPNTNVCPICLGLPGTLPVLNKRVIEMATRASLALNCTVHEHSRFARKNYFYPDLPKGYQISQYELPLVTGGYLEIEVGGSKKADWDYTPAPRGGCGEKSPRRIQGFADKRLRGLQPLRVAAERNCQRARFEHAGRG